MERTASIESATILAFPVGGRRNARAWASQTPETPSPRKMIVDYDAWYHQAAVSEDKPHGNA